MICLKFGKEYLVMRLLIKNNNIEIVYTQKEDLLYVLDAEREQENAKYVGQWSFEQHEKALDDEDTLHLIVKNISGKKIGYIIMKGITNQNDSIEFMRIVITDKGYGYGKDAISLIKKWCFEIKHAHRLWLDVRENNVRAQHVYQSLGFKREGILRECIKLQNSYHNLIVMSILFHEYNV